MNYRISWFAGSQAFLVAAFTSASVGPQAESLWWLSSFLLPLLGVILSALILQPLYASLDKLRFLNQMLDTKFKKFREYYMESETDNKKSARKYPIHVAIIFIGIWAIIWLASIIQNCLHISKRIEKDFPSPGTLKAFYIFDILILLCVIFYVGLRIRRLIKASPAQNEQARGNPV